MRILLVGNFKPDAQQSMQRYAGWLTQALRERGHSVTLAAPAPFFARLFRHPAPGKYLGYIDKFLLFPPRLRRMARSADLVHVLDHSNSMYLSLLGRRPHLITCHDMLAVRAARGEFPSQRIGWSGRLLQRWILRGMRQAHNILCVSHKTEEDLQALIGPITAPMRVVPNPLNWRYRPDAPMPVPLLESIGLAPGERYFLHVGGNQFYKNRPGVLQIFARALALPEFAGIRLVMAGKPFYPGLRDLVGKLNLSAQVIEAVNVSNEELQALYSNALFLMFPSLEEGFGWPLVEAQACGCPVITSNRQPMMEIAGEGAIFIDPEDAEGAAHRIAEGFGRREELRRAGFANVARFDQDAVLDQYLDFYREITAKHHASRG